MTCLCGSFLEPNSLAFLATSSIVLSSAHQASASHAARRASSCQVSSSMNSISGLIARGSPHCGEALRRAVGHRAQRHPQHRDAGPLEALLGDDHLLVLLALELVDVSLVKLALVLHPADVAERALRGLELATGRAAARPPWAAPSAGRPSRACPSGPSRDPIAARKRSPLACGCGLVLEPEHHAVLGRRP